MGQVVLLDQPAGRRRGVGRVQAVLDEAGDVAFDLVEGRVPLLRGLFFGVRGQPRRALLGVAAQDLAE